MKKNLLLVLILILPAFAWLFKPGYFPVHDNLQAMRQLQMDKCFRDLQIPCRWVLDMGYGFGYPLFNYYPPLPYLIGEPFRFFNIQYLDIVKIVGVLGFVLCAVGMYLLAKEFFGPLGGLLSALFYTYAPYHSVDYWVRGAVNEFFAMAFYPWIFLTIYLLIKTGNSKYLKWVSLSVTGLMLSHNLMLLIFFPVTLIWILFWLIKFNKLNSKTTLLNLLFSGIWALGLSAFFTLPVLFETKFAHVETLTMGYFNYLAHFLNIRQIFLIPNWGYGASVLGPADELSFFLGYLQWIVPIILVMASYFIKKLKPYKIFLHLLLLLLVSSLFMTHNKSTFIWDHFKLLQNLQFPWRFLTISVFLASFISGAFTKLNLPKIFTSILLLLLLLLNGNYFHPRLWYPDMTDQTHFSGQNWLLLQDSGIFDYLPIYAKSPPGDPVGSDLNIISGQGNWQKIKKVSNYQQYQLDIDSNQAVAEIQTFYFPGWTAYLNGQKQNINPKRDPALGRIQVDLAQGSNNLRLRFENTPIRSLANMASWLSWIILLVGIINSWIPKLRMSSIFRPLNPAA